jgi:ribose transport system permease protein
MTQPSSATSELKADAKQSVIGEVSRRQIRKRLQSLFGLALVLIIALIASPHSPRGGLIFLEAGNITDVLRQVSEIGIISLGMTFVILTGGIDLSVGTVLALASSIVALVLTRVAFGVASGVAITAAIAISLAAATFVGFTNGWIIARLRIQPFIVTLATMIGVRGLARWLTSNTNIDIGFGADLASIFSRVFSTKTMVIGSYVLLSVVLAAVLAKTIFGRYVRAVGDNEKAARYAGLPISKTKITVYTMTGLLAGCAGVLHAAQNHQGNPNSGVAYELEAIAAVVIGGTSLAGGSGSIWGTVVGTLIIGVLTNILRLNNVDSNVEMMIKAGIILGAVWIQRAGKEAS